MIAGTSMVNYIRKGRFLTDAEQTVATEAAEKLAGETAEAGKLAFIAEKVAAKDGWKLIPVLGVVQGLLDASGSYWDAFDDLKDRNYASAAASATAGYGGLLMAVGSYIALAGDGTTLTIAGAPAGAVLIIAGSILEVIGMILKIFFPEPDAYQDWVTHCIFGVNPEKTIAEQISDINELVYTPQVKVQLVDEANLGIRITVVIANLCVTSEIRLIDLMIDQPGSETLAVSYQDLRQGKTDYGGLPKAYMEYDDNGRLISITIDAKVNSLRPVTVTVGAHFSVETGNELAYNGHSGSQVLDIHHLN
jgi:hypothetical protein